MQAAVVHLQGSRVVSVVLQATDSTTTTVAEGEHGTDAEHSTSGVHHVPLSEVADPGDPGPILPEMKELAWGAGSFVVFALLMRFALYPRLKRGMDARNRHIRDGHESADQLRTGARSEVAEYEAQVAAIRAEAAQVVDAARQTVEGERQARLAEVNARLDQQRAAALQEANDAREAARGQIHAAVSEVAGRAGELATGSRPSADVVDRVVGEVMAR
ncbi:MAG: ATP synthase F0 subunit B [Ilumatobacteraceae bacterium]